MNPASVITLMVVYLCGQYAFAAPKDAVQDTNKSDDSDELLELKFGEHKSVNLPPPEFTIEWEPATGMAAGEFRDVSGYLLTSRYLRRALLRHWEEAIYPRTMDSTIDDLELWVSGWPEQGSVLVKFIAWGFRLAIDRWEGDAGYRYGRFYFRWNNVRRGFFELRQRTGTPHLLHPAPVGDSPAEVDVDGGPGAMHWSFHCATVGITFWQYRPFFLVILKAMIDVAEGGVENEDTWSSNAIIADGGQIDFYRPDTAPQMAFQNGVWILMMSVMITLPLKFNPPRYTAMRVTVLHDAYPGVEIRSSLVVPQL